MSIRHYQNICQVPVSPWQRKIPFKHVPKQGADDKRAVTLTLAETLNGDMLSFQMTYTGKTSRTLPTAKFSEGILLGFNKSHWSNEEETLSLVKEIISPYITKVKQKLKLV